MEREQNNIMANDIRTTTLRIEMPSAGYTVSRTKASFMVFVLLLFVIVILTLSVFVTRSPNIDRCSVSTDRLPEPVENTEKQPYHGRLPQTMQPTHYKIKLTPYLDAEDGENQFRFDGRVEISTTSLQNSRKITLHGRNLDIHRDSLQITDDDSNTLSVKTIAFDKLYDFITIETYDEIQANRNYVIGMEYKGTLNNSDQLGFYVESYKVGNDTRYIALTQLETLYARRVFPSFDEPRYKARFDITIKHRVGRIALCNMPSIRNESDGEWMVVTFDTTPIMSTYIIAMAITDFKSRETTTKQGVLFRVWSQEELIDSAEYALHVGSQMLDYLNDLWGIPYPLPKLDMIAAPDFAFGAMENWGLVIYVHHLMLYNKTTQAPDTALAVANIIGHELVHQWFGNLVTLEWWKYTWLNEGFARYFEFMAVDFVEPSWDIFNQFYQNEVTFDAMESDAIASAHPTIMDVGWDVDIWKLFDSRGYERGASMNQMMRYFLGDAFMDGLRNYLKHNQYKNTETDDLWHYLTEASIGSTNIDVKEVMDPWLFQTGFPVVTVTRTSKTTAVATQRMYVEDKNRLPDLGNKWHIPLTYTHSGRLDLENPEHVWLKPEDESALLELFDAKGGDWLLVNIQQYGFYRVNYDPDSWDKLIQQLTTDHEVIPVKNRAALIDDVFSLSRSLDVDAVTSLRLAEYLQFETENYSPWGTAIEHFDYLKNKLERTAAYGFYKKYLRRLIKPLYDELGWDFTYDDQLEYHLRRTAVEFACYAEDEDCLSTVAQKHKEWVKEDTHHDGIPTEILDVVLCDAIEFGSEDDWQVLLETLYHVSSDVTLSHLSQALKFALSCTRDYTLVKRYLEESLELDDDFSIISYVRDNSVVGYHLAWQFVMSKFDLLVSLNEKNAYELVWTFAVKMNSKKDLLEMEQFGREYNDMPKYVVNDFYEALDIIKFNIAWMDKNYKNVYRWLKRREGGNG
ncbi:aminopeptidase N-like [Ptychodera flava]|uniref:aminopeptidase N-like n=1 Tax=Ptychodera flava TaxID=63121 RepID=UPI003969CA00